MGVVMGQDMREGDGMGERAGCAGEIRYGVAGLSHPQSQVFIYPGEAHAFLNSTSEASAKHREQIGAHPPKPENQQLAWERLFAFFDKHLKQ